MYRICLYISIALVVILSASLANATGVCTGYPLMYNGKPCASTTRYWDGQMGACGCGTGNTSPFSWQWTKPTAAASAPIFGSGTWCGSGCGKCYKLTPTAVGASVEGTGAPALTPLVVKVTNLCPYTGNEGWCAYDVNSFGYDAHFDLMDYNMNGIISGMGWNNPEVTYEEVDCAANGYTDWNCQCGAAASTNATVPAATVPAAAATKAPTTAPAKAATSAPTKAATSAPATVKAATSAPSKAATSAPATAKAATSAPATAKAATSAPVATVAPTTVKATTTPASSTATGNVQVQVNSGSNTWWIGVSLVNPAISAISSIQVKDASSTTWSTMTKQGNDYWNLYSFGPAQALVVPLSLRFTGTDGNVVTATNIITSFQAATVDTGVVV
jgi:endoglucanase